MTSKEYNKFTEEILDSVSDALGISKEDLSRPAISVYDSSYRKEFKHIEKYRVAVIEPRLYKLLWQIDREQNEIIGLA